MAQISARGSKGHHTFYLSVVESGTNIENNTSTVTINFWLVDDNNWYFDTWGSRLTYSVVVNGTTYSGNLPDHDTKTTDIITNQTQTITHNNDGTKQISFSFSTTDSTGQSYTPGTASASGTLDLTTLPRASDVSASNATIAASSGNYSFTITSKANFYHKWRYTLNGTVSSWSSALHINATTSSPTIAYTALLSAMSNTAKSTITIEVQTYSDSACTNLVGTKSATATITVTLKPSAPTLTTLGFRSRSSGVNSNITTPTAGYTTVALTAWSHGTSSGASSYTTYFSVDQGATLKTSSATANNTVIETDTLPVSAKQYTLTYTAYTVDSRGNQSANATKTVVVYGYTAPLLTLTAYRTASNDATDTTEDGAGLYSYVAFSNTLRGQTDANGALRSGNQNAIVSATCKYGSTSVTSGQHIALAETDTRTFVYTVQDRFTTTSTFVTIPQAKFPLDLYDDGSGNVGAGVGAVAKANQFNFGVSLASNLGNYQEIMVDLTRAEMMAYDTSLTGSSTDDVWLTVMLKMLCVKYPAKEHIVFKGMLQPNSYLFYQVMIYNTSTVNNGLPQYSFGYYSGLAVSAAPFRTFGTHSYNFYFTDGVHRASISSTATNANNIHTTAISGTSYAEYYPTLVGGASNANQQPYVYNGMRLGLRNGTASQLGYSILRLGNAVSSGTEGNKYGALDLYPQIGAYYVRIQPTPTLTNNRTCNLPDANGTLALHDTQLWTGSLTGTNSIDLDISAYKRIRIYALYATDRQMIWEVDVTKLHASTQHRCNHCEMSWLDNGWYHTIFETFISKASFTLSNVYNMNTSGTTYAQNNSTAYQIYRIDGIL